jgi:hypothetical protein
MPDLSAREWALVAPTIAMAILMGVVPGIFLRPMEPSVNRVVELVTGNQPATVRTDAPAADVASAADRGEAVDAAGPPSSPDVRSASREPADSDRADSTASRQ